MKNDKNEKLDSLKSEEDAKKEVNQLIELRTNTLTVQYDQIRSDFNAFKEETDHTLKNLVADVAKLHRSMAKTNSMSKDNGKAIETLQQLILTPTETKDPVKDDEKVSQSPASTVPSQPIDQFKRILALISIQQKTAEQQRETSKKILSRISMIEQNSSNRYS